MTGSAFYPSFVGYYGDKGLPFLRVADLGDVFLKSENMVRILPEVIRAHRQVSTIGPGDLVVAKGGSIGGVCIVTDDFGETAVCRDVIAVETDEGLLDPYYLAIFFNTRFGRLQLERNKSQQVQAHLTFPAVERMEVAYPGQDEQDSIRIMVIAAYEAASTSGRSYDEAQRLLESELGLDKLIFHRPAGYTAQFSELEISHRADAQHYQPRFSQLIDHISTFPSARVRDIRVYNRRGLQPVYVQNGSVDVVNSQHLGPKHIDYEGLEKTSGAAFAAAPEAHIRNDDVLIYTTGAYVGRTNVYLSNAPAMASNHVNILRLRPGIDAAYMALVFQSVVGQFQTLKHARGSAQAELYPTDIDRFLVPLLDTDKQERIGNLVRESLVSRQESRRLLEQAKTRVEQLIEEAKQA